MRLASVLLCAAYKKPISIPLEYLSHTQRVKSLYKRAVRNTEAYEFDPVDSRYACVLLRARFDENKNETDIVRIKQLVSDGEKELFKNAHASPIKFPTSPGGTAFERQVPCPDWAVDYWHPLEKAQYPTYFARREERKKEFVLWWEKQYGKPAPGDSAH